MGAIACPYNRVQHRRARRRFRGPRQVRCAGCPCRSACHARRTGADRYCRPSFAATRENGRGAPPVFQFVHPGPAAAMRQQCIRSYSLVGRDSRTTTDSVVYMLHQPRQSVPPMVAEARPRISRPWRRKPYASRVGEEKPCEQRRVGPAQPRLGASRHPRAGPPRRAGGRTTHPRHRCGPRSGRARPLVPGRVCNLAVRSPS